MASAAGESPAGGARGLVINTGVPSPIAVEPVPDDFVAKMMAAAVVSRCTLLPSDVYFTDGGWGLGGGEGHGLPWRVQIFGVITQC